MILGVMPQEGFFKGKTLLFVALLLGVIFIYRAIDDGSSKKENGNNAFLTDNELVYTKHAKCRMDCRNISKAEVEDILHNGKVNKSKTRTNNGPCPSYALEGVTADNQHVRIIFADCNNATKVVTTIDLDKEYDCYCE